MLKIWGRNNSVNVQKVLWACDEMNVAYERTDAGGQFGVVGEAFYKKMNPNSRVPTLVEEDGFVLWESNAIVRYLGAQHGAGTLWPEDLRLRADADRWMDWTSVMLGPVFTPLFWQLIRTAPVKRDQAVIDKALRGTIEMLNVLELGLEGRDYMAGPQFTMGDIPIGAHLYRWFGFQDIERPGQPNIEAYYRRLTERAAYRKDIMIPLT
jgi:glutathione S-transferase